MKRTNTAVWLEKYNRWQIKVQKDGIRKTFTSSTPGRNGQRECNHKADEWLDDNTTDSKLKVSEMSKRYMEQLILTTSRSHYRQYQGYFDNWINRKIGNGRDRMTIVHEFSHFITLCIFGFQLARSFDDNVEIPAYCDPEWQAKCLAGELMIPAKLAKGKSVSYIVEKCGVSYDAAAFQLSKI